MNEAEIRAEYIDPKLKQVEVNQGLPFELRDLLGKLKKQ